MRFNCPIHATFKQTDGQDIDLTEQDVYTEKDNLEIQVHTSSDSWTKVEPYIFRSWKGPRRINSIPYDGPVFYLGSTQRAAPKKPKPGHKAKVRKVHGHWRS